MKFLRSVILFSMILLLINGCGDNSPKEATVEKTANNEKNKSEDSLKSIEEKNKAAKEHAINKAIATKINSYELIGNIDGMYTSNGQRKRTILYMKSKFIRDPLKVNLQTKIVNGNSTELYMDKEYTYISTPELDGWFKLKTDTDPVYKKLATGNSIQEYFSRVKNYLDLYSFTENNDTHTFKVNLTENNQDQKSLELMQGIMKDSIPEDSPLNNSTLSLNSMDYTLELDKDYLLKSVDTVIKYSAVVDGNTIIGVTTLVESFNGVNELEDFDIPSDVLTNAKEY